MTPRIRYALIALAVGLAVWSLLEYRAWGAEQERLAVFLDQAQIAETFPDLADRVRRANDPLEARIRASRPLVAHYLNPTWLFDVPDDELAAAWQRSVATLEEIRTLAADAMAHQPTSWEAPMLYGAATYLLQPRGNLAVSMSDLESWELPLKRAQALTPQYLEPARYLTVAYVQHWQTLSAKQREAARLTLARAFRDAHTFNLVIELWLRLVPDRREAMRLIPDEPFAWGRLERIFQRRREWRHYLEAHERYLAAEERRLTQSLDEAEARVAGGDYRRGTDQFHFIAATLEPDMGRLELLERVLDRMPAGPVSQTAGRSLRAWLEWTLELGFLRQCPLAPERLRRLAGSLEDISLHEAAMAAMLAGDLAEAEAIERRRQGPIDRRWGPYLTLKVSALVDRGTLDEARLALQRVDESWEQHPTYLAVARDLAEARTDVQAMRTAEEALEALPADAWHGGQMTWRRGTARLELVPAHPAAGLVIRFLDLPAHGRPIEIFWNGGLAGTFVAYPDEPIRLDLDVDRRPSLLELRAVDNRPFVPGPIALLGSEPPLSSRAE